MIVATRHAYPIGSDFIWIGSDQLGQAAVFVTAGTAPMPIEILQAEVPPEAAEEFINRMPVRTGRLNDPGNSYADCFDNFVERGFFVFDWSDIHRVRTQQTGTYQRISAPQSPIFVVDIPLHVRCSIGVADFPDLHFNRADQIDVKKYHLCREGDA